jgi:DNA-binding NtrC family response regulator
VNKVLLIEDAESLAAALQRMLEVEGYEVVTATDPEEGLEQARTDDFQVVITDLKMPGISGMDVIRDLHRNKPQLPVILMTGHHTTEAAIEAMKLGAYDYITKPPDAPEFLTLIEKAVANSRLMSEQVELGQAGFATDAIIGSSRMMQNVYKEIGRVAAMPVTVLIRGETGTGKELVARAIYQHSDRADKPFIEVNCVAIPENLLESELFGHEPGAFTDAKTRRIGRFEQANNGTLLLDEIGDMSPSTQGKLLRVLQNRLIQRLGGKETIAVDVRVIAATHRDLESAIQEKQFREDLYHRLNHFVITLPPLRERLDDIPELVKYFVQRYSVELGLASSGMPTTDAMEYLRQQPWPGNVRELRNIVRKSLLFARGYPLTREIVNRALTQSTPPRPAVDESLSGYITELLAQAERGDLENVQSALSETVERELYRQAIRLAKGDQTKAAGWIGVSRPTMKEKLLKHHLHPSQDGGQTASPT